MNLTIGRRAILCTALAAGVVFAGCVTDAASDKTPYVFAVIGPLSGDNAVYGISLRRGTQLAADQINAADGIKGRKVQLEFLDTQCQATQAANAAAKIASDPSVWGVIGDVCSSATLAAIPILYRAGIAEVSGDSTSPLITKVVKDHHYDNFSRTINSDIQQGGDIVKLAIDALHKKRIGILYASDDFGQPLYEYEKQLIPTEGGKLVGAATYTPTTNKDFTPQWTSLAAATPDVIIVDGYYNDAGTAVSQMSRAGLSGVTLICSGGIDHPDFMRLGGSATEGAYVFSEYNPSNNSPQNVKFATAFQAKYHEEPNEQSTFGYEIPFIYKMAIEKGATKDTLAKVVRSLTFVGPTGVTRFDSNGDVKGKPMVVDIVKDGKLVYDAAMTKAIGE